MEEIAIADYLLWAILIGLAAGVILSSDLIKSLVYLAIFSLIAAGLYTTMGAPDAAITEAAIGAAISSLFFLATIGIVGRQEIKAKKYTLAASVVLLAIFAFVLMAVPEMPKYGDPASPATTYVANYYITNTVEETGITNSVTSVLASYRGFDTLGEIYVILTAAIGVLMILPLSAWRKG